MNRLTKKEKHAGGRPLEYSEEILKKAWEYLESCVDEEKQTVKQSSEKYEMFDNKLKVKIPTKGGLARYLDVARETLYDWARKYPEFSDVMEAVGAEQEERLINNGLSGDYNPTIAKVLLSKHGYREGIDTDMTSVGKPLDTGITTIINKIYGSNGKLHTDSEESE